MPKQAKAAVFAVGAATLGTAFGASTFGQPSAVTYGEYRPASPKDKPQVVAGGALKMDEALLNAKLDIVEARTETKFAQLLGELKVISTNVSNLGTQLGEVKTELGGVKAATAGVKWNIVATGLALGGLILALAAYGQQMLQIAAALVGLKH